MQEVRTAAVPDESADTVRAELVPLVVAASDSITTRQSAVEDADAAGMRAATDDLRSVRDGLHDFTTEYR